MHTHRLHFWSKLWNMSTCKADRIPIQYASCGIQVVKLNNYMHQDNNMCFCTLVQFIKSSKGVCSLISLWFHSSVLPWCKTWTINHVNLFPPIIGPFKCFLALVLPLLVLLQMSWLPIFPLPYASYSLMECHSVFRMLGRKYTLSSKLFSNLNKSCKFTFLIFLD